MASTITDLQIQALAISQALRNALVQLNDATATATTIAESQVSIEEKRAMKSVLDGVATRTGINSRDIDLPVKFALLSIANV